MAITWIQTYTNDVDGPADTEQSFTLPSANEGDIWILAVSWDTYGNTSWNKDESLISGGWTEVRVSSNSPAGMVYWRRMTSTGTLGIDIGTSTVDGALIAQSFRGVDADTIEDAASTQDSGTTGDPNSPSITTVTDGAMVVSIGQLDDDSAALNSGPSGYTNAALHQTGAGTTGDSASMIASKVVVSAGVEDPGVWDTTGDDAWVSATVALRPEAQVQFDLGPFTAYVGPVSSTNNAGGGGGLTPAFAAELAVDDIILLFSHRNDDLGVFVVPTGYTELTAIGGVEGTGDDRTTFIAWKVAVTADVTAGSVNLTHTDGGGEEWSAVAVAVRGVNTASPINVTPTASHYTAYQDKGTTNANAFDSITTASDVALVFAFEAITNSLITTGEPTLTGYDRLVNHQPVLHRNMMLWGKYIATASTESPGTPTMSSSAATADGSTAVLALSIAVPIGFMKTSDKYHFGENNAGNDVVVTVNSLTLEDDLMIAIISTDDYTPDVVPTPPSGWTLEFGPVNGTGAASDNAEWFYSHVATAADETNAGTATYTWSFTQSEEQVGILLTFDGGEWGQEASNVQVGAVSSIDSPTVTTTVDDELVFFGATKDDGDDLFDDLPTLDKHLSNDQWGPAGAAGSAMALGVTEYATAQATGVKNWGIPVGADEEAQGWTFSIRPTGETVVPQVGVDAFALGEALVGEAAAVAADSAVLSEAITLDQLFEQVASDAFTLAEAAVQQGVAEQFASDAFNLTEVSSLGVVIAQIGSDSFVLSEAAQRTIAAFNAVGVDSFALSEASDRFAEFLEQLGVDSAVLSESAVLEIEGVPLDLTGDDHLQRLPTSQHTFTRVARFQARYDYRYMGLAVFCTETSPGVWSVTPYPGTDSVYAADINAADFVFYGGQSPEINIPALLTALQDAGYTVG